MQRQSDFLQAVKEGRNIFLTGKAGTGKSFAIKEAQKMLTEAGSKFIAIAPTGIAATNIDGQTIHSVFRLDPFSVLTADNCNFLSGPMKVLLKKVRTIIIDEISMLRPDVLDAIHWTLRKNGLEGLDSRQVIFVGDLKQLPAIIDENMKAILYQHYDGETFQHALVYDRLMVELIELDEVLRQSDEDFINALNIVREGGKSEYFRQFVTTEAKGVILAPHNNTVKKYNDEGLARDPGELFRFEATYSGHENPKDYPLEQIIEVKSGSKIIYLVNSMADNSLKNGTLGTFIAFGGAFFIRVGSIDYPLEPAIITKKKYIYKKKTDSIELEEIGSVTQYPIKLAYALSIHKAQGLTFDEVTVDLQRACFQKGQLYVALSRVRTPEGLSIIVK